MPNLGNERILVGELTGLLLRVDILAVDPHLEDAPGTGDEADTAEGVLVVVRDLFRQTDGFGEVPSSGAVLDLELHDAPPNYASAREDGPRRDLSLVSPSSHAGSGPGK